MLSARELLLSALDRDRPAVLLLGQDARNGSHGDDPILRASLDRLGRSDYINLGWSAVLEGPVPPGYYGWLAERFERRVHAPCMQDLSELPWSAVFTSSLDPTLQKLMSNGTREPHPILSVDGYAPAARSTNRPPLYYLFSRAGEPDPKVPPPTNQLELLQRRIQHAVPLLGRILETATSLGVIVVDGFGYGDDWLRLEDLFGTIFGAPVGQVLWFGGRPDLNTRDATTFEQLEKNGIIVVDAARLGTVIAELRAVGTIDDLSLLPSQDIGTVSFNPGLTLATTPGLRLRVEAAASIVDDSWSAFLSPQGPDAKYDSFRRFHGDLGGHRLLVEGVRRGFAIERGFEARLYDRVAEALSDHSRFDSPIIIEGQSGTGKSVALARLVAKVRERKIVPALYAVGRIPLPHEVSDFCQAAERVGAKSTLLVCDANKDVDSYDELLIGLRSRGRRVVVVGSQYRAVNRGTNPGYIRVEAPTVLTETESNDLAELIEEYLEKPDYTQLKDHHFLAVLYRFLPASRPRIGSGLGAEARTSELRLRERGDQYRPVIPISDIHRQLIQAGYLSEYEPTFNEKQIEALQHGSDSAGRIIDFVMVAGKLNCPVPVNLLLRAVNQNHDVIDADLVSSLFEDLDLFRWDSSHSEGNELIVRPRLTLEAELICRRRLGGSDLEARRLVELIGSVRQGIDNQQEIAFLLNLLQQIGRDSPPWNSGYEHSYADVAAKLTELRREFNVMDPSLMLQESVFRRNAVFAGVVPEEQQVTLLEEARDVVQTALDEIDNGMLRVPRRMRQRLLVERATIYGFLASDLVRRMQSADGIWSAYQAAREAIRQAVSGADTYHPHDVGLWTPADLLKSANLAESQRAELTADIYSMLDQVEPGNFSPTQQERFHRRRMLVGNPLADLALTEDAYQELQRIGSTAGYYIRAREYAPDLAAIDVEVTDEDDVAKAVKSADFLTDHIDDIIQDERCLSLLLECRWIAEMRRRPLRGQRQPLPVGGIRRDFLNIVQALNETAGESRQYLTRYLEAVLTWLAEDYRAALDMFRELGRETDNIYRGRTFKRHVVSDRDGNPQSFSGRIEEPRGEGRWLIRVRELNETVVLLESDFQNEEIMYERILPSFAVAFNFIGPIADQIRR